jgi:hypothetical protein
MTSLKWQLMEAYTALLNAVDDLNHISKDPHYKFSSDDLKEIRNKLAGIKMLAPELVEKLKQ